MPLRKWLHSSWVLVHAPAAMTSSATPVQFLRTVPTELDSCLLLHMSTGDCTTKTPCLMGVER